MKIIVKVKPNSKIESVERITQSTLDLLGDKHVLTEYKVSVKEHPIGGKANNAVSKVLAKYFNIAPSLIKLTSGTSSKKKTYEIIDM